MPVDIVQGVVTRQMADLIIASWNSLKLKTAEPVPMTDQMFRAIIAGDCDPIPLLCITKKTKKRLFDQENTGLVDWTKRFKDTRLALLDDFVTAIRCLLKNADVVYPTVEVNTYKEGRVTNLHSDELPQSMDSFSGWNVVGRLGALPTLYISHHDLDRLDAVQITTLKNQSYFPQDEDRRAKLIKELRAKKIIKALELGTVYLMRGSLAYIKRTDGSLKVDRTSNDGCQHLSTPVEKSTLSCFIRAYVSINGLSGDNIIDPDAPYVSRMPKAKGLADVLTLA